MKLSKRLLAAAALVRDGGHIVDVGTDHAYLPIKLISEGRVCSAIACDIGKGPLENAAKNVARYSLEDKIDLRLGNGLEKIAAKEVDDIVICGMGGELIAEIIEACSWAKSEDKRYILQPMTAADDLRKYLCESGFKVEKELLVKDAGRLYVVMRAVYDGICREPDLCYLYTGTVTAEQEYGREYLQKQLSRVNKHIQSLENATDKSRISVLKKVADAISDKLREDNDGKSK